MEEARALVACLDNWNVITIIVRLILSMVCGGIIGLTRSVKRRGAGFKTHSLVCLGSALVMMTGQYIYENFGAISDIARLAAQVVSGVGFLGVGTIMVTRDNHIKGLTTAAGLWTCAGIGLSIGIGFYSGAVVTTVLVLFIYKFMGRIDEIAYEHSRVLDVYIEFESRRVIAAFLSAVKEKNYKIIQMELNKSKKNKDEIVNATLVLEVAEKLKHDAVIDELNQMPGVEYAEEI